MRPPALPADTYHQKKKTGPETAGILIRLSLRTLRNHLHHASQKHHTRNRLEAVMQAARRGLI